MKAKLLTTLSEEEATGYKQSSFYLNCVLSSFRFTDNSIAYYDDYFNREYSNHSIVVFDDLKNPVLALYSFSKLPLFSNFDLPVSIIEGSFTDNIQKQKAYKELLVKLNETLSQNNFEKIKFYNNDFLFAEYYSNIDSVQIEYNSYVDLALPEEMIKTNIRKSYKSLVNWGEKNLDINIIDHTNPDHKKFMEFKEFHIATAGRKTRSDKSWDLQFESIKRNEGFLVTGHLSGKPVSGSLILHGKKEAYYAVGVYDRELMSQNIAVGHYNILCSIYQAKKIGLDILHLGFTGKASEEKEKNIFKFKAGFTNTLNVLTHTICNLTHQ